MHQVPAAAVKLMKRRSAAAFLVLNDSFITVTTSLFPLELLSLGLLVTAPINSTGSCITSLKIGAPVQNEKVSYEELLKSNSNNLGTAPTKLQRR